LWKRSFARFQVQSESEKEKMPAPKAQRLRLFIFLLLITALFPMVSLTKFSKADAMENLSAGYPSGSWRYRMTVRVETPEGIKTGSSVREIFVQLVPQFTPEMKPTTHLNGEAVVVDLGSRGVLYALLRGYKICADHGKVLPFYALPFSGEALSKDGLRYYSELKAGPKEVDPELYPVLVFFQEPKDIKTAKKLIEMDVCDGKKGWPKKLCIKKDRFEEAFGKGVRISSVVVEMTRDPVTTGIQNYLPKFDGKPHLFSLDDFVQRN
jgi:hypothetical protein